MAKGRTETYCLKFVGLPDLHREIARNRKKGESTVIYYNILTGEVSGDVYNELEKGPGEPWIVVGVFSPFQNGTNSKEVVQLTYERLFGVLPQDVAGYDVYGFGERQYSMRWR